MSQCRIYLSTVNELFVLHDVVWTEDDLSAAVVWVIASTPNDEVVGIHVDGI